MSADFQVRLRSVFTGLKVAEQVEQKPFTFGFVLRSQSFHRVGQERLGPTTVKLLFRCEAAGRLNTFSLFAWQFV